MSKRSIIRRKSAAAALTLSLFLTAACPFRAQANVFDDGKEFLIGVKDKAAKFLDDIGVIPAVKSGYNTAVDFVFNYETQPDDPDMESLARSWAITTWLGDDEKEESNTYYFDNHTLTMVEDLTKIGHGYNLKKQPEGSSLNGVHTGVLRAVVNDATTYSVEWVNYDDEMNMYLLKKMQEKKAAETEASTEAAPAEDPASQATADGAPAEDPAAQAPADAAPAPADGAPAEAPAPADAAPAEAPAAQ